MGRSYRRFGPKKAKNDQGGCPDIRQKSSEKVSQIHEEFLSDNGVGCCSVFGVSGGKFDTVCWGVYLYDSMPDIRNEDVLQLCPSGTGAADVAEQ